MLGRYQNNNIFWKGTYMQTYHCHSLHYGFLYERCWSLILVFYFIFQLYKSNWTFLAAVAISMPIFWDNCWPISYYSLLIYLFWEPTVSYGRIFCTCRNGEICCQSLLGLLATSISINYSHIQQCNSYGSPPQLQAENTMLYNIVLV